jgi:membrane protease YdiL (CAAX protease family)
VHRARALIEVLLCSGFPTQLLVLGTMRAAGMVPRAPAGELSLTFVSVLSMVDAILVISLVLLFLKLNDESPRELLLGARPRLREAGLGLLLIPVSFFVAVSTIVIVNLGAPWLHNVARNPFEAMLRTTSHQLVLAFVVTVAGGLREEVQRAFILHRFERSLGGALIGLVLWSLAFGLGHLEQGRDVAIATAALGAFWGVIYLRRRSIVSPAIAHAGFNLSEILRHALG